MMVIVWSLRLGMEGIVFFIIIIIMVLVLVLAIGREEVEGGREMSTVRVAVGAAWMEWRGGI